jgi:hypothetical protein
MIRRRTVFVLGAGASYPYDFPKRVTIGFHDRFFSASHTQHTWAGKTKERLRFCEDFR